MMDIIYFELNNWFSGRDYPNAEPFKTWCGNDLNLYFLNEEWVKQNKLVVVATNIDMSVNWCITTTKKWVEENCPKLLSDESTFVTSIISSKGGEKEIVEEYPYSKFLRFPDEDGEVYGRFGCPFLEYSEENFGISWWDEYEGWLKLDE